MQFHKFLLTTLLVFSSIILSAQVASVELSSRQEVEQKAKELGIPVEINNPDGSYAGLIGFDAKGFPVYYTTDNANAAKTINVDSVRNGGGLGLSLDGQGIEIGEWDGGAVLSTHQELTGRVTQGDSPSSTSSHATHVAGTMIASGVKPNAKGMATAATVSAYDFYSNFTEMSTYAQGSNTRTLSNHSYGTITGWYYNGTEWYWYGDTTLSATEDHYFGFYNSTAKNWDSLAILAPYHLMVKSAGNDRNDVPSGSFAHKVWDSNSGSWVSSTTVRPQDGGTTGYDCISTYGNAKNILTVGAVADITSGYTGPSDVVMSSFSGWGPSDDGRIKPDIVANGIGLYSSHNTHDSAYTIKNGTSMSAPNATGALALIQNHYHDSNNTYMTSALLKALVIQTADEAGTAAGPDYAHGWGLMNTTRAVKVISDGVANRLIQDTLVNGDTLTYQVYSDGSEPLRATITWTDPTGTVQTASVDPTTKMLVNDLDLRIIGPSGASSATYSPYKLSLSSPSAAATTGDNDVDNVEQVHVASPTAGYYTIRITHKGNLQGANQAVGVVVSGLSTAPSSVPVADFTGSPLTVCIGDTVFLTDLSTNSPTSWLWEFFGPAPFQDTVQNPAVVFTQGGVYAVKLTASNSSGSDDEYKASYIIVNGTAVSASPVSDVCEGATPFVLTFGSPIGGTYSGPGVSLNLINPAIAGLGTHNLTYTMVNTGCTTSVSTTITITGTNLTVSPLGNICVNASSFPLNNVSPTGGNYSGPGVSSNNFDPSVAGVGTHSINYSFTDTNGCVNTTTQNITVINTPTATFSNLTPVCANTPSFVLTGGSPIGGLYYGPGVNLGQFDPAVAGVGTHTIGYVVGSGQCTDSATATITVTSAPTANLDSIADQCLSNDSVLLTTSPSGGSLTGPGVYNGYFYPDSAGVGVHTLVYSVTNGICADTDSVVVEVFSSPNVTQSPLADMCSMDSALVLSGGLPAGGSYTGPGVAAGVFDPSAAGAGQHSITYTYSAGGSCVDSATVQVQVIPNPTVIMPSGLTACDNDGQVALSGALPAGGTYSGVYVSNGFFNADSSGTGTFDYYYLATANGCSTQDTASITVNPSPSVSMNPISDICNAGALVPLTGGMPSGGVYSGTGISSGVLDPSIPGIGQTTVYYTYTDSNSCTNSDSVTVNIVNNVVAILSDTGICADEQAFTLAASPSGGSYSGFGITNDVFDPALVGPGTYTVVYDYNVNGCSSSDTAVIDVNALPNVSLVFIDPWCLLSGVDTLSGGTPLGGTYSGPGVVSNTFDPSITGTGNVMIEYFYSDSLGCASSDSALLAVVEAFADFSGLSERYCEGDTTAVALTGTPGGGVFAGPGIQGSSFTPSMAGAGVHSVTYATTGACADTMTQSVTVIPGPSQVTILGPTTVQGNQAYTYWVQANNGSSYTWNVQGGTVISQTANVITVSWSNNNIGSIEVIETNSEGCSTATTLGISIWPTSVLEINQDFDVSAFPNPAGQWMQVSLTETSSEQATIQLRDGVGRVVLQERIPQGSNSVQLQVGALARGMYTITVDYRGQTKVIKALLR